MANNYKNISYFDDDEPSNADEESIYSLNAESYEYGYNNNGFKGKKIITINEFIKIIDTEV